MRGGRITALPKVFSTTVSLMAECKEPMALVHFAYARLAGAVGAVACGPGYVSTAASSPARPQCAEAHIKQLFHRCGGGIGLP